MDLKALTENKMFLAAIAGVVVIILAIAITCSIVAAGSNKESTLNFYRNNGFEIDQKHSCLKRL